jgi:hypothetical protein
MLDEDGEPLPPSAFLEVAEEFDLVQELDCWVLREAIRMLGEEQRGAGTQAAALARGQQHLEPRTVRTPVALHAGLSPRGEELVDDLAGRARRDVIAPSAALERCERRACGHGVSGRREVSAAATSCSAAAASASSSARAMSG